MQKEPWVHAALRALTLYEVGEWQEGLAETARVCAAAATEQSAREGAMVLLVLAAAAGYARQALEVLTASPAADALEPLVVGLRIYLGESPLVAQEILEVGKDVAERIRQMQAARQKSPTPPAAPPAPSRTQ